jgi:hypothetical protein
MRLKVVMRNRDMEGVEAEEEAEMELESTRWLASSQKLRVVDGLHDIILG